ncbi:MAG: cysteine/glutathione ABC transporter ATP-binding protein/permease CydC [Desulfobacterales bacterium]|nr:cysteine/glutathione ABC transporter ATP-binding protein/permease CydC [Desulfobacterales bacterium]
MPDRNRSLQAFVRLLSRHWKWMVAGSLFGLIATTATVGLLALSGWFLSAAAFAGLSITAAQTFNYFFPSIGVRIFAISRTLARYAERVVSHDATFRILESLRIWFYERIEPLAPARLMRYRSGDILNRVLADIDALDNLYLRVLSPTLVAGLMVAGLTVFLSLFDPLIALTTLGWLVVAGFGIPAAAGIAGAAAGRRLSHLMTQLRIQIVEGIQGLPELLVFNHCRDYLGRMDRNNRNLLDVQRLMSHLRGVSFAAVTLTSGLAVLWALYQGAALVSSGVLHGASLAMIALTVLAAFDALMPLPSAYQYLGRTREAARELLEVVGCELPVAFPENSLAVLHRFDVSFDRVSFRYTDNAADAVHDIRFHLPSGQRFAVLGPTGAGKSTLAHLMVRFWDVQSGSVRIGGEDIRNLSESVLRQSVSLVSQQAHMFNASVRDNLLIARPGATEPELWQALAAVWLADFVKSLPQGIDTWIGESGRLVSGGQARRLALARAILRDAPIWVLDEPTEGLDRATERRIMETLFEVTSGRTVLFITHRLVGLDRLERILLMEDGRIVEQGTHAELLQDRTRYAILQAGIKA